MYKVGRMQATHKEKMQQALMRAGPCDNAECIWASSAWCLCEEASHDAFVDVVDLRSGDSDSDTSICDYTRSDEDGDSSPRAASPTFSDWATSDEDECEVVARMAGADWDVVSSMMSGKMLKNSALVKIIMPYQQKPSTSLSRRGGRRGSAVRTRRLEEQYTL
jgi:hypothetical protein